MLGDKVTTAENVQGQALTGGPLVLVHRGCALCKAEPSHQGTGLGPSMFPPEPPPTKLAEQDGLVPKGDSGALGAELGCWEPPGVGEMLQDAAWGELVPPAPGASAVGTVGGLGTLLGVPSLAVTPLCPLHVPNQ